MRVSRQFDHFNLRCKDINTLAVYQKMKNKEGVGGSRAAKKRAKKRTTQEQPEKSQNESSTENMPEPTNKLSISSKKLKVDRKDSTSSFGTSLERRIADKSHNKKKPNKKFSPNTAMHITQDVEKEIGLDMDDFYPLVPDILKLRTEKDESKEYSDDITTKQAAHMILQSLLYPGGISVEDFFTKYWEKEPLYISAATEDDNETTQTKWVNGRAKHRTNDRFKGIFSSEDMKQMLNENGMRYTYDVNVTKCDETTNMIRINYDSNAKNPYKAGPTDEPQIADCKVVWNRFSQDGCTVRFLCPQKYHDTIHSLCSTLESEFGCMVGCNAYLTPGHASQGFAPHYDDIEAFILQVEGKKRWRVYAPINGAETLPRLSSDDFVMEDPSRVEVEDSDDPEATADKYDGRKVNDAGRRKVLDDPVLDVVLEPGDLLYMPRGWIHQGKTLDRNNDPSLHLTISCMQSWSWADLIEFVLPDAMRAEIDSDKSTMLREGLPVRFLDYMGVVHDTSDAKIVDKLISSNDSKIAESDEELSLEQRRLVQAKKTARKEFHERCKQCIQKICQTALTLVDASCDELGKRFLSERLPPVLTPAEQETSNDKKSGFKIKPNTLCRILRDGIARLVIEDEKAVVYHCIDNSREFHGNPIVPLEFELDDAPALEMLLTTCPPHWISVHDLIHDDIEDKVGVAQALFDEGVVSVLEN